MLIWFAVVAVVAVALIFKSAEMDMRFVMVGVLLPVGEALVGGPWVLHTPAFGAIALAAVMVVARGQRHIQRRWLGVPVGLLAHLVLDGTWADTDLFWWPFTGVDVLGDGPLPEFGRGATGLLLEVAGLGVGVWAWRYFGLDRPEVRRALIREGRLTVPGQR
ncbi:MAG: hypothetical protein VYD11_01430 [Actinomycetota bacterium]|nr:hypothetical protein [Actinomycetota bacterium]MED5233364.1 hypothetical protein [Actinomycetota bacterium]